MGWLLRHRGSTLNDMGARFAVGRRSPDKLSDLSLPEGPALFLVHEKDVGVEDNIPGVLKSVQLARQRSSVVGVRQDLGEVQGPEPDLVTADGAV